MKKEKQSKMKFSWSGNYKPFAVSEKQTQSKSKVKWRGKWNYKQGIRREELKVECFFRKRILCIVICKHEKQNEEDKKYQVNSVNCEISMFNVKC